MHARALFAGLGVAAAMGAWPSQALAGPSSVDDGGAPDVDLLMRALARDVQDLSVADCTLSCKALASMERARDRICELSPGARCDEARAKVASARDRVATACRTCATHERPEPAPPYDAKASPPPQPTSEGAAVQSEHKTGGCAGCRTAANDGGHGAGGDAALVVLATLALRGFARRRPKKPRADR